MAITYILFSCGNAGEQIPTDSHSLGVFKNLTGTINSQGGGQDALAGWFIAIVEKNSAVSRVAQIDATGQFAFGHVYIEQAQTLILLSEDYIIRAVLTLPSETVLQVNQYFKLTSGTTLPHLIQRGSMITWQDTTNITIEGPAVLDNDGDQIPDGVSSQLGLSYGLNLSSDLDGDRLDETTDLDIDGDGLLNPFDSNDDGDSTTDGTVEIYDDFDDDKFGDNTLDLNQKIGDTYFSRGFKWIMITYDLTPTDFNNPPAFVKTMNFLAKLNDEYQVEKPNTIHIRSYPNLPFFLQGATTLDTGEAWNGLLKDDGLNEDGAAGDGLYARKILIDPTKRPISNQVIFFNIYYKGWSEEFPFTFGPVNPSRLVPNPYNASTRTITFMQKGVDGKNVNPYPFGNHTNFNWIVTVYEVPSDGSSDRVVFTSPPLLGSDDTFVIPENVIDPSGAKTYRYKISAQSKERIRGYSTYRVHSMPYNIANE